MVNLIELKKNTFCEFFMIEYAINVQDVRIVNRLPMGSVDIRVCVLN